jgi:KAP family P-loop domain
VQALHDEVGIVSRVRRALEQLNEVVKSHQDADDAPQRVVFYIDDLDRCRAEQVVRVLEAVHLLLAFDRFVVVVGVDTRWLETSLMSFYDEQLRANRDDSGGQHRAAPDPRATVRDYVEKIFQVPIQIPRLTIDEGGTFARLIDTLSPVAASDQAQEVERTADAILYDNLPPIEPLDLTVPEPERFHEAVARAQLSAKEVGLLKQLGPLAGRSPRAVKRLLNLYRLLRATRTGSRLTEFLEGSSVSGNWPDYPGIQLCLAVEVGLPAAQVHRFREAVIIAAGVERATPSELLAWPVQPGKPWSGSMTAFFETLSPTQPRDQVGAVLRTITERFGDDPQRLRRLREIVVETSRFSFSPLADSPLSGSAKEAAFPSAVASEAESKAAKHSGR